MKNSFIYTLSKYNFEIEHILNYSIDLLQKNNNFEIVILSCSNNQDLNIFIDKKIQKYSEIKFYRPLEKSVSPAHIKNFYLKLADNRYLTFLNELNIVNSYFLLHLPYLTESKLLFANDTREGLFLTAHRNLFLKMNGFDATLFSNKQNIEDEDIKNRIIFSRKADPILLSIEKLINVKKPVTVNQNNDNFTSLKNTVNCKFILPTLDACKNIIFNNEHELN